MKNFFRFCFSIFVALIITFAAFAQNSKNQFPNHPTIKRTTVKTERLELGVGGSVTILGAPEGAITVEAWREKDVEITAEITNEAATESDLAALAAINSFIADASTMNHVRVLTVGLHDKTYLRKNHKKLLKHLLNAKWRIDYKIKVPAYCDLEINAGRGALAVSGIDGTLQIKAEQSDAHLNLVGGVAIATIADGNVNVNFNQRSWRGGGANVMLAKGTLNVGLPPGLNADVDAEILRTGKIENNFDAFKPRERSKFTDAKMTARTGAGGAQFTFTVGDGTLRLGTRDEGRGTR